MTGSSPQSPPESTASKPERPRPTRLRRLSEATENLRRHPLIILAGFISGAAVGGWKSHEWFVQSTMVARAVVDRDYIPANIVREKYVLEKDIERNYVPRTSLSDFVPRSDVVGMVRQSEVEDVIAENERLKLNASSAADLREQLNSTIRELVQKENALREAITARSSAEQSAAEFSEKLRVMQRRESTAKPTQEVMSEMAGLRSDIDRLDHDIEEIEQEIKHLQISAASARVALNKGEEFTSRTFPIMVAPETLRAFQNIANRRAYSERDPLEQELAVQSRQPPAYFAALITKIRDQNIAIGEQVEIEVNGSKRWNAEEVAEAEVTVPVLEQRRARLIKNRDDLQRVLERLIAAFGQ